MPTRHKALLDLDVIAIDLCGVIKVRDVLDLIDAVENDPECTDDMASLVNLKDVEDIQITQEELGQLADINHGIMLRRDAIRRTSVWAPTPKICAIANDYYSRLSQKNKIIVQVSDDAEKALAFLLDEEELSNPAVRARLSKYH